MILFTIGSGQKSAEKFFSLLKQNKVQRLIDIRLNNKSQLAGFTKSPDLQYFLKQIAAIDYIHLPILAPTQALLAGYREKKIDWAEYERSFGELLNQRNPLVELNADVFDSMDYQNENIHQIITFKTFIPYYFLYNIKTGIYSQ